MTWIVGTPTLFGHAILVSDICVTFRNDFGKTDYVDCLQKIYPVGKSQMMGFSGSVSLGFKMVHQFAYESSKLSNSDDWIVEIIANTWLPRVMRRIYNNSTEIEKELGCSIILASAHPQKNLGDVPWPETYCHIFDGPDFEPKLCRPGEIKSIGSGSNVDEYKSAIKAVIEDRSFNQMMVAGASMQGLLLAKSINKVVDENPKKGISKHYQIGIVERRNFSISNNDYKLYPKDGPPMEVKLPKLARNYNEFQEYCKEREKLTETSSC